MKQQIQELEPKSPGPGTTARAGTAGGSPTPTRNKSRSSTRRSGFSQRQRELDKEDAAAAAKTQPRLTAGCQRFHAQFRRHEFCHQLARLAAVGQPDVFRDDGINMANDSFLLRRARPIISGTVFHDFDFNSCRILAAARYKSRMRTVNYRYRPELQLQAGKFKSPVGLEHLQADRQHAVQRTVAGDGSGAQP